MIDSKFLRILSIISLNASGPTSIIVPSCFPVILPVCACGLPPPSPAYLKRTVRGRREAWRRCDCPGFLERFSGRLLDLPLRLLGAPTPCSPSRSSGRFWGLGTPKIRRCCQIYGLYPALQRGRGARGSLCFQGCSRWLDPSIFLPRHRLP